MQSRIGETGKISRIPEGVVREAHAEREKIKHSLDVEQSRCDEARKRGAKVARLARFFRLVLFCRRISDRTTTRIGGFVNVMILGGALALVGSGLMGLPSSWRMLVAVVGSSVGAGCGVLLFAPDDSEAASLSVRFEREFVELNTVMCDVQAKVTQARERFDDADAVFRKMWATYQSRINQLLNCYWKGMTGVEFENFLVAVFEELGYEVRTTKVTGDQGVDLIITKHGRKVAIQAKGYPGTMVGNKAVQEAHTGMAFYDCQAAAVVTNSNFTSGARELAMKVGCALIGRDQIPDLIEGRITL